MQYYTAKLNLDELCLIIVSVENETDKYETRKNRNKKCRQLIATESNIIAAPHDIHLHMMHVVLQKSFYGSGKFQIGLPKLGLKEEKLMAVTYRDYQVCFHYSLLVKLTPQWNEVGNSQYDDGILLVKGANFLTSKKPLGALKIEVTVAADEIQLAIQAFLMKIPTTKFTNFGVTGRVGREFTSKQIDIIPDKHIKRQWCFIFPSLKMGKVVEISRDVPSYSDLKDYSDMRTFWKEQYGYQLPPRNDFYYGVYFNRAGRTMTYPRCCILPDKPNVWPSLEAATHVSSFIKDINMKLAVVCGQGLNFIARNSRLPMALIPATQTAGEGEGDDNSLSLSST